MNNTNKNPISYFIRLISYVIPQQKSYFKHAKMYTLGILFFLISTVFSSWLMFHTFSYDQKNNAIEIASKCWSDFGAHIPLIRSFSMGENSNRIMHLQAPEYPIFPGVPIRYHFIFYAVVGMLEKSGVRIDWALNILSILGFAGLLSMIAITSYWCFRSYKGAVLSVLFFLFNGTFSFLQYFRKHPLSWDTPWQIYSNTTFPSFGPWDNGLVSAFWNLNIFTNQRHLAAGFMLGLLFIMTLFYIEKNPWKKQLPYLVFFVPLLIFLPYFHQPILIICALYMLWFFCVFPRLRIVLFLTGLLSIEPILWQLIPLASGGSTSFGWYPGYLIHGQITAMSFFRYWLYNFGLHTLLIPIGFILAPKKVRHLFIPALVLFILANSFKFSVEIAANHKFFNFFIILGGILSAHVLVTLFSMVNRFWNKTKTIGWFRIYHPLRYIFHTEILFILFLCMFSGIIDFFVIFNDRKLTIIDIPRNEIASWIASNTPKQAIILNSSYLYHPASIAGRSVFLGWPYFPWSAGYKENRMPIMDDIYASKKPEIFCPIFQKYAISYLTVEKVTNDNDLPDIDPAYFLSLGQPVFTARNAQYMIFEAKTLCPSL